MNHYEIGGYFELELPRGESYHPEALAFNNARNALRFFLKAKKAQKVWLPLYICESVTEALKKDGVNYSFYRINKNFEAQDKYDLKKDEYFLYVNYFGLQSATIEKLKNEYERLIVDNSQAFFSKPQGVSAAFYSPRKFFGVADGGYLISDLTNSEAIETDQSCKRYAYALMRHDLNAEQGYEKFIENESILALQPVKKMSKLTRRIMHSIDYEKVKKSRKENFAFLAAQLAEWNEINLHPEKDDVPMVYPLLISKPGFREYLIENKIYVAQYWKEVLDWTDEKQDENRLSRFLVALPVDQRYSKDEMLFIVQKVKDFL